MKVAIVHYWFTTRRGGEKVVESILKKFPQADIYTLFYDKQQYGNYLEGHNVYTSIFNTSFIRKHYQKLFPIYPLAVRSLKLKNKYDLIISSESGPAKGISKPKDTLQICYIHTPMRYCWGFSKDYIESVPKLVQPVLSFFFRMLRIWDKTTVDNVDLYIANSNNVKERVNKFYKREAKVIYPPINEFFFTKDTITIDHKKDIFLSFGAITPYKRIDLLVDVFNQTGDELIIIGDGSEKEKLEKKAKSNIQFLGTLDSWSEIESYFNRTKALLFPGEEDFGMIPLEVMAYGIPVLAYNKGGAKETVLENKSDYSKSTGMFFNEQSIDSIKNVLLQYKQVSNQFDPYYIKDHASNFKEGVFLEKITKEINNFMVSRSI